MADLISYEEAKKLIDYDPEAGSFTWRVSRGGEVSGTRAGGPFEASKGIGRSKKWLYLIGINYKIYRGHRIAWLLTYGEWPKIIDHWDGNPLNNRLDNLRSVSSRVNSQNIRSPMPFNRTGLLGAGIDNERGGFRSEIRLADGSRKFIGRFATAIEAHEAYVEAKRKYHEGCTI